MNHLQGVLDIHSIGEMLNLTYEQLIMDSVWNTELIYPILNLLNDMATRHNKK